MATKKTAKKEETAVVEKKAVQKNAIIRKPLVTEKAAILAGMNAYTFEVAPNATKNEIKKAINALYKVTPASVRTVTLVKKRVMPRGRRGKIGLTGGGKKAYVYLKKGDKIEVL